MFQPHQCDDYGGMSADIGQAMFQHKSGTCEHTDLCLQAAALLGAELVVCSHVMDGVSHPTDCGSAKMTDAESSLCKRAANSTDQISYSAGLITSLRCPCKNLHPEGSRSKSIIQRTSDRKFIVKQIKADEMLVLSELNVPNHPNVMLNGWSHADPLRRLVVMPNMMEPANQLYGIFCGDDRDSDPLDKKIATLGDDGSKSLAWDVKPLPAKSKERSRFLAFLVRKRVKLNEWKGWDSTGMTLRNTLRWLAMNNLVDYSMFISAFRLSSNMTPECKIEARRNNCFKDPRCAQEGKECNIICLTVLDYLMEYSIGRQLESTWKKRKWHNYKDKTSDFFDCLGDLTSSKCEKYLDLGCQQMFREGFRSRDELKDNWCMPNGTWNLIIPHENWLAHGCVPDPAWTDEEDDDCEEYEGMPVSVEDVFIRGSQGKTPLEACCVTRSLKGVVYATQVQETAFDASHGFDERFWKSNGCVPDASWMSKASGEDCIDYEGMPANSEDMNAIDLRGRSPAEACCLEWRCGEIRYYDEFGWFC